MPGVDPHVPQILRIEREEFWDDWLCQGWVCAQPIFTHAEQGRDNRESKRETDKDRKRDRRKCSMQSCFCLPVILLCLCCVYVC